MCAKCWRAESVTGLTGLRTAIEDWVFNLDYADRALRDHFRLLTLDGCGLSGRPLAVSAAGAILHYLRDTQKSALDHLDRPSYYDRSDSMILDAVTVRNLELLEPLFAGETKESTLIHVLDQTCTGMGGRLLRHRLLRPCLQARGDRSAAGCGAGSSASHHRALGDCASCSPGCWIWSACSRS